MKAKVAVVLLIICMSLKMVSRNPIPAFDPSSSLISAYQPVINANDSIVFDLASATLTPTYLDLPLYIKSDDPIFSFDFAMRFDLTKLTYSTSIDMLTSDPTVLSYAYYNQNDLFLRLTSSSLQGYPTSGTHVVKVRFALNAPCTQISSVDFTDLLAILNGTQCSAIVTNLNFAQFLPSANFINGPSCLNASIQFTDASTVGSGTISSWLWSFSDGSTSTLQNPGASFTVTGAASATLIVTADSGCQDTIVSSFNINELPVSGFSYSFSCVKDSVFFMNTSSIPSGTITNSLWDFGEAGASSNLANPSYHYNASGFYTVSLTSVSGFSCTATNTLVVNLTNKVSANFAVNPANSCLGSVTSFSDATTYSLSTINAWNWNFGDGGSSAQQNPGYTYTTSGTYSITLTSTSADGCKGTITRTLNVNALPSVQFGISTVTTCILATASFTDLSTGPAGSGYSWNFGDGETSASQNPVHSYSVAGVYPVKLIVTTLAGCLDSLSKSYTVSFPPPPEAPFSETILSGAVVSFSNLTTNAVKINWNFGDSQTSLTNNPVHTFPNIGTYNVCLTTFDAADCPSSSCREIYVGLSKIVAVPSAFTPNDDNVNDVLKVRGGPMLEMEFMIFNQWGNLIFSSNSQELGWDGTFGGEAQPVGVYEYVLKVRTVDDKKIKFYGAVNLVR